MVVVNYCLNRSFLACMSFFSVLFSRIGIFHHAISFSPIRTSILGFLEKYTSIARFLPDSSLFLRLILREFNACMFKFGFAVGDLDGFGCHFVFSVFCSEGDDYGRQEFERVGSEARVRVVSKVWWVWISAIITIHSLQYASARWGTRSILRIRVTDNPPDKEVG